MPAKREPQEGDVVMILPMCADYDPNCWVCEKHTGQVGIATGVKYGEITVVGNKTNAGGFLWDTNYVEVLQHA